MSPLASLGADLVKSDVEGVDLALVKGGLNGTESFQPFLVVEIQADTALGAGNRFEDTVALLKSLGSTFFVIGRKARLRRLNETDLAGTQNVLCVPAGGEVP